VGRERIGLRFTVDLLLLTPLLAPFCWRYPPGCVSTYTFSAKTTQTIFPTSSLAQIHSYPADLAGRGAISISVETQDVTIRVSTASVIDTVWLFATISCAKNDRTSLLSVSILPSVIARAIRPWIPSSFAPFSRAGGLGERGPSEVEGRELRNVLDRGGIVSALLPGCGDLLLLLPCMFVYVSYIATERARAGCQVVEATGP
jgi:hypothetical protein